jgi:hypothetical protein
MNCPVCERKSNPDLVVYGHSYCDECYDEIRERFLAVEAEFWPIEHEHEVYGCEGIVGFDDLTGDQMEW